MKPLNSTPPSPSLISQPLDFTIDSPLSSAVGLITPEMIRPYPKVNKNTNKISKKGKMRIYTDTPGKYRLEEIEKAKKMKKQEQERKNRAKEMKHALLRSWPKKAVNIRLCFLNYP